MNIKNFNTWIFDLDNTLYSAETGIFDQIDQLMGKFISKHLNLEMPEAKKLQKEYFKEHGTTLRGLMNNHYINPELFLNEVPKLDYSIIKSDILMKKALENLKGRKIIFTNANKSHVDNVLNRLNINNLFNSVYDITDANYFPKPDIRTYKSLVYKYNIDSTKTIMFDDIAKNLVPASKLGFTTVWIDIGKENYSDDIENSRKYLNYETTNLPLWLNSIIKES